MGKKNLDPEWDDFVDELDDFARFQEPKGRSSLRRASRKNPRNLPCPTCGMPNRLTKIDVSLGYQCNRCADAEELY